MNETEKDLALSGYQETIRLQELEIDKLKDIAELWKKAWKDSYDYSMKSADPMDGSRICDQDGNRADLVKAVEETKGIWEDRDDLWDRTSSMNGKVVEVICSEYFPYPLPKHVTYHVDGDREWVEPVILQKTEMMEIRINRTDDDQKGQ